MQTTSGFAPYDPKFSQLLRQILERIGMNSDELSDLSGLGGDVVEDLRNGNREVLEAQVLRIGLALLLTGTERWFLNRLLQSKNLLPLPTPEHSASGRRRRQPEQTRWLSGSRLARADRVYRSFADFLNAVLQMGMTQTRLAQLAGFATWAISRLTMGVRKPTEVQILRIAAALLLCPQEIDFLNRLLVAADLQPMPVPGRDITGHDHYRPTKRRGWAPSGGTSC